MNLNAIIQVRCHNCHDLFNIKVNKDDYYRWRRGANAQDVFHYLSADDRELLISNTCGTCWDQLFGGV